jgi:hypothetical protein
MNYFFLRIGITITTFFMLASCCNCGKTNRNDNHNWVNPKILMVEDTRVESSSDQERVEGFDEGNITVLKFVNEKNSLFEESGLSQEKASSVYKRLFTKGLFRNEPVGMPSPDDDQVEETLEGFKQRVALRKTLREATYEFFLQKTGCGYSYIYGQIIIDEEGEDLTLEIFETLHLSVPC